MRVVVVEYRCNQGLAELRLRIEYKLTMSLLGKEPPLGVPIRTFVLLADCEGKSGQTTYWGSSPKT